MKNESKSLCILRYIYNKSTGLQFDKVGNWRIWLSENTTNVYDEKAQCFIDQYNRFSIPEANFTVSVCSAFLRVDHFSIKIHFLV